MSDPGAESAYLFRHALTRDAAYQLQRPEDLALLHALALAEEQAGAGDRAAEHRQPGDPMDDLRLQGVALAGLALVARNRGEPADRRLWSQAGETLRAANAEADLEQIRPRWEAARQPT